MKSCSEVHICFNDESKFSATPKHISRAIFFCAASKSKGFVDYRDRHPLVIIIIEIIFT